MNFDFMAGSMGAAVGEGFVTAARLAVLQQAAFIVVTASGGARMQEGALSLMQMARTTIAVQEVKEAGLPYIVILTDPTTGGVTASFAMLGDIHIAEPGAVIGFAGARVIEQTIREKLPRGVPAGRVSEGPRHGRHGGPSLRAAGHARAPARPPACAPSRRSPRRSRPPSPIRG